MYGGDELMYVGLTITDLEGDYQSIIWILKSK
ncbi:GH36 C-terminal domain-containing protein [Clostridium sp. DSM 17811]